MVCSRCHACGLCASVTQHTAAGHIHTLTENGKVVVRDDRKPPSTCLQVGRIKCCPDERCATNSMHSSS
eukprot:1161220-Pelagomonas_calceolata.AAC.29